MPASTTTRSGGAHQEPPARQAVKVAWGVPVFGSLRHQMRGDPGFSEPTLRWLETARLSHRKSYGQYMTPKVLREKLMEHCDLYPGIRVLDPGVGTGEFLRDVRRREPARRSAWVGCGFRGAEGRLRSGPRRLSRATLSALPRHSLFLRTGICSIS